jgi:glutamate racemase
MWVPLVENNEHMGHGADFFVKKNIRDLLAKDPMIDTVLLACTHYPLMLKKIEEYMPVGIRIVSQGDIVASSLADYLARHPAMEQRLSKNNSLTFYTTDSTEDFDQHAAYFFGKPVSSTHLEL